MTIEPKETIDNSIQLEVISIDEIIIDTENRREINEEKVNELVKSISEIGLLHPIIITTKKELIAGFHRLEAYKKLNHKKIPCKIVDESEINQLLLKLIRLDENLVRYEGHFFDRGRAFLERKIIYEQLYPETKKGSSARVLSRDNNGKFTVNDTVSFTDSFSQDTANKTGISSRTIEREIQLSRDIIPEVQEFIKEQEIGKKEALLIAREKDEEKQRAIIEELKMGVKDIKTAISTINKKERKEKKEQEERKLLAKKFVPRENIIHDSLENVLDYLEPGSVDLILTDPPYPREYLHLWKILFEKAFVLLKEGGMLVTYSGHLHLPEIFQMNNDLKYVWTMTLIHSGARSVCHPSRVNIGWKPLLIFVKGAMPEIPYFEDVLQGKGREKGLHEWQQALGESEELIKIFSKPKQLVVDPFLGSGTTILAARNTDRNFFGMDIDELAIKTTMRRLEE